MMQILALNTRKRLDILVPQKYQQTPRLGIWYKHGFSQARRGFTPTDNWLRCLNQDKAVSEAYCAGYRAGITSEN